MVGAMVSLLVGLVVLVIFLWLLSLILDKLLPMVGLDASWKPIILGIIGLIVVASILYHFGDRMF